MKREFKPVIILSIGFGILAWIWDFRRFFNIFKIVDLYTLESIVIDSKRKYEHIWNSISQKKQGEFQSLDKQYFADKRRTRINP